MAKKHSGGCCVKCGRVDHSTEECIFSTRRCYNCQEPGHDSSSCPKFRNFWRQKCMNCGAKGHTADDCLTYPANGGIICSICAQVGHSPFRCPTITGNVKLACQLCEEQGHLARACTNVSKWKCTKCTGNGHLAKDCPKPEDQRKPTCPIYSDAEHNATDCPSRICLQCGGIGHSAEVCPSPNRDEGEGSCIRCGNPKHTSWRCPPRRSPRGERGRPQHDKDTTDKSDDRQAGDGHGESRPRGSPKDTKGPRDSDNSQNVQDDGRAQSNTNSNSGAKSGPTQRNEDAMKAWRKAKLACALGSYTTALPLLSEAISLDATVALFYTERAIAYGHCKNYVAALGDIQRAEMLRGYTRTCEILTWTARCFLHLGSRTAALHAVRDALKLEDNNKDAQILKKRLSDLENHVETYQKARSRQHWRMARMSYESCLEIYAEEDGPLPIDIRCWGIELKVAESDWTGAMRAVDHLLSKESKAIEVMTLRALVLFLTGKFSPAIGQAVAALRLDPDSNQAIALRSRIKNVSRLRKEGQLEFQAAQYDVASVKWSHALELLGTKAEEGYGGPVRADLLHKRATAMWKLERFAEGLKDVDGALELNNTSPQVLITRGRLHVGLELYEQAVQDFNAAAKLDTSTLTAIEQQELEAELRKAAAHNKQKDYYQILGLARTCTALEIRKAYRTESLKHHPDKGGIAEKFKLVVEAYSVLSDPSLRKAYDDELSRKNGTYYGAEDYNEDDDTFE